MRNVDEVLDKFKEVKGLVRDADLARYMDVKPSTVASWRTRETLPHEKLIQKCEEEDINLSWLFMGKGEAEEPDTGLGPPPKRFDSALMKEVIQTVEGMLLELGRSIEPAKKAELMTLVYEEISEEEMRSEDVKGKILKFVRLAS